MTKEGIICHLTSGSDASICDPGPNSVVTRRGYWKRDLENFLRKRCGLDPSAILAHDVARMISLQKDLIGNSTVPDHNTYMFR